MLVRLGPTDLDPELRPIVLVASAAFEHGQPLEMTIKQAIGQGADLVEVPAASLGAAATAAVRDAALAIAVVGAQLTEVDVTSSAGAAALRWNGDPTRLGAVRARLGPVPLIVTLPTEAEPDLSALQAGDWLVVPWDRRERLAERASGVIGLVDLGARRDRAELAAAVTVAMEDGPDGFVTVAPMAVRRAAHTIRAVERAR